MNTASQPEISRTGINLETARIPWKELQRFFASGGAIALVQEGDTIEIDIPNRSINLRISDAELAQRRAAMEAKGKQAWKPAAERTRKVSAALRAYAAMVTSADKGAVRDVSQVEK